MNKLHNIYTKAQKRRMMGCGIAATGTGQLRTNKEARADTRNRKPVVLMDAGRVRNGYGVPTRALIKALAKCEKDRAKAFLARLVSTGTQPEVLAALGGDTEGEALPNMATYPAVCWLPRQGELSLAEAQRTADAGRFREYNTVSNQADQIASWMMIQLRAKA